MSSVAGMSIVALASIVVLLSVLFGSAAGPDETFAVTPPAYAFNNASHAFVNLTALLGDESVTLRRLLLDSLATVFYFQDVLDTSRFVFHLHDFNGTEYPRELIYAENQHRNEILNQTPIRFAPMDPMAAGFTLSITDLETNITTSIDLTFDDDAISFGRHLYNPVEVETGLPGISVSIDSGVFSAFTSSINISVVNRGGNAQLVFGGVDGISPINMRQAGFTVPTVDSNLYLSDFGNGIALGSMDFSPLRSLMGRVDIDFGHIYKRYDIGETMGIVGLLTPGDLRARSINFGDHVVNISGVVRQGPYFVMVMHGLMRVEYEDEYGETQTRYDRMPTTAQATIFGVDSLGRRINLPVTHINYDHRGTDVMFDTRVNEAILDIPLSQLYLEFEAASVRLPALRTSIHLNDIGFTPSYHQNAVAADIIRFFDASYNSRMSAPAGATDVQYRAQVRQIHIDGNNVYARVTERLSFVRNNRMQEIVQNHRVTADLTATGAEVVRLEREN